MIPSDLLILVVDENRIRASIIETGLRDAGHDRVVVITEMHGLVRRMEEISPDVIIIDLENPNRDLIEHFSAISSAIKRPVAMFVDQSDREMMEAAIGAGVSAYVVDGLRQDRVKSILDMAVARFNAYSRLKDELEETRAALEDRKVMDRAKGILIRSRGLTEDEAHHLIRKTAMRQNRRMADVARSIVSTADLLLGDQS